VLFRVTDTQRPAGGLIVHRGELHGRVRAGETVTAEVDAERRAHTMRNHTGTHLLHRALRNVVGERARQAGSRVAPEDLRFDYPFDRALTDREKRAIEAEVRRIVREDRPVIVSHMTMQDPNHPPPHPNNHHHNPHPHRTVRVDGYSHELCGGTHCRASGQIGSFVITGERSIGSGMRRIEALTGAGADAYLRSRSDALAAAAEVAGAQTPEQLPDRIRALQDELRETRRRLKAGAAAGGGVPKPGELAQRAEEVAPGTRLVTYAGPFASIDEMKGVAKDVRGSLPSGVIALGLDDEQPQLFVTVSDDLVATGISAGDLVREAIAKVGGKGGGRPEMAQGKGSNRDGLADALGSIRSTLTSR
jgi:alanyl-tRNA synthetase